MLSITRLVQKLRAKTLSYHDIKGTGGAWLGAARNWIQWNAHNGSDVTWGSDDPLVFSKSITVSDIEALAARITQSALEDHKENLITEGERAALKAYKNPDNWVAMYGETHCVVFKPNRDNMHFLASFAHKDGWDIAEIIDKEAK